MANETDLFYLVLLTLFTVILHLILSVKHRRVTGIIIRSPRRVETRLSRNREDGLGRSRRGHHNNAAKSRRDNSEGEERCVGRRRRREFSSRKFDSVAITPTIERRFVAG